MRRLRPAAEGTADPAPLDAPAPATVAEAASPAPDKRHENKAAKARRLTVTDFEKSSTRIRTVILNLAFVGAALLLVPVLASQFWLDDVVIEPISVPDSLSAMGLTSDVVASRLWDGLQDAEARANTSKEMVNAIPNAKRIKFSIPETGVSFESLVSLTRQFFHAYQTRIGGEFICSSAECRPAEMQLRLRVVRDKSTVVDLPPIGTASERDYFTDAGVQVLTVLDPYVAIAAAAEREPVKAVTLARQLIRAHHPDAKWAHNLIGNILGDEGDTALAALEYRAALELDPNFRLAKANLANVLRESKQYDEARALYADLERNDPRDPIVKLGIADITAAEGDLDKALVQLKDAAALAPDDPQYLSRAGELLAEAERTDDAIGYFEQALAIDPSFPPALGELGKIYFADSNYAAAEPLFRDLADFSPNDAEAQALHGQSLMLVGRYDDALARFDKALAIEPQSVVYLSAKASVLFFVDRADEAHATLETALAIDPDQASTQAAIGQIELMQADFATALTRFEKAAELEPGNPDHAARIADALYFLGRVPEAIERLEALAKSAPDRVNTWFTLGNYYATAERFAESKAAYERFLADVPDQPMYDGLRELARQGLDQLNTVAPAAEDASK